MSPEPPKRPITNAFKDGAEQILGQARAEVQSSRQPWYRAFQHTRVLIAVFLLLFIVFALLAWFVHIHPVLAIDVAITHEFQENRSPWLKDSMLAISYLGSQALLFIPLVTITVIAFWLAKLRLEAILIGAESIVSHYINTLLKIIVSRPRPTSSLVTIIQQASGQSFPSGHVMSYMAYWGLLLALTLILFKLNRWWHYVLVLVSLTFIVLIGPSRIYLGDHWASDVLGGYLFGGLLLGISLWIYLKLKKRGVLQEQAQKEV
ncbi:phosphatase PAP2 family protein [Ktedonosporobacter rubrisoli]|nr:phosphatase PAP2 family protein [Ktedonosporobacter rubrisoli]